ncbi:unnamed protein product [Rhizophagus irregularis]|uniref:Uncharacterized protein n=1 Tax=Rhizophagus irregularis TaxID=588596 RepID=A0A915Z924_9GLOM|nr:unnamed protein product [Rhizophagus irregularis]
MVLIYQHSAVITDNASNIKTAWKVLQRKYPHKTSLGKYIFIFFIILLLTKSVIQSEDNIGFISTIITGDFESFINFLQQLQNNTSDLPTVYLN